MDAVPRISVAEARRKLASRPSPLLVCGYDDDEKCRQFGVKEAIGYNLLNSRLESIPKDREIIFFCA